MVFNGMGEGTYIQEDTIPISTGMTLDQIVSGDICRKIYASWDESKFGPLLDFGGGVRTITCSRLMELFEGSHYKLSNSIAGLTRADAKAVIDACNRFDNMEPYR